jgi:integrase
LIKQIIQQSVIQKKTSNLHEKKKRKEEFPDLLFTTKFGTPLNSQLMSDAIKHIVEEINLTRDTLDEMEKFGGHVFRHTFATRCFEAGIPPKTVQAYLGHASLQMTMDHYTSVLKEKEKDDMKKLEDTIGVKGPGIEDYQHNIIRFCV